MGLLKSFFFRAMNSGWYGIIFIIWIGSGLLVCPCVNAQNSPSFIPEMENKKAPVPSTIPAEAIPDQRMEKRLNAIFAEIPDFAEISASVHQGVVQLTGRADSLIDVQEAKKLAERLEGVIFVISDIRIQPEIGIQFAPMFREAYRIAARFALFFPMLFLALIMVFVFWLLGKIIIKWEWPFTHLSQNRLMRHFLRQFISHLLLLVGILLGLHVLGLTAVVSSGLRGSSV
jgi:small conductance mechanosensitive channel